MIIERQKNGISFSRCVLATSALAVMAVLAGCPEPPPEAPSAVFTASAQWGQAALPVTFTDASTAGTSAIEAWLWNFGDGETSTEQNPSHVYSSQGSYTVSLTVTSANGTDTLEVEDCVVVTGNDVIAWNSVALDAVASAQMMPPQASRVLAMMHAALYDAVNAVEQRGDIYYSTIAALPDTSKEAAAAQAAHDVLAGVFPEKAVAFDERLADSLGVIPAGAAKTNGIALGGNVADAILQWRSDDGSQMAMPMDPYVGGTDPGEWRPTPPTYSGGMFVHWAMVTPFAIATASQFRPDGPPALSSTEYAADYNEVKQIGAKTSATRTMDQSMMATFWVGMAGTIGEAGRMNVVAQQAATAHENTLFDNARLFLLVNAALADAAIAGIDCKYEYSAWRPVTAIWEAAADGNDGTEADVAWEPYIVTPAHPEYISTHSVLTMSAAAVLAAFFGSDDADLTLAAFMDPNMTRHYSSFSQVAEEASHSRIYGGIHFRFSCEAGLQMGREIGDYVSDTICLLH